MTERASNVFAYWRDKGLSARAANSLCNLPCGSIEELRELGPEALRLHHGLGPPTYNEIAALVGWDLKPVRPPRRKKVVRVTQELVQQVLQGT